VQRGPRQAADGGQGLHPSWELGRRVGVHGAGAAVVPGVERGQQVAHLGAADLPDDQPVRAHPQRLPDQVAHGDPTGALDVDRSGHQPDHVRVPGPQLLGVLHDQ
jgi:hypothetical protein